MGVYEALQLAQALVLRRFRHLACEICRGRSGTRAVLEGEGLGETRALRKRHRISEVAGGLAGEADDDVSRECDVGARRPHLRDRRLVVRYPMLAVHGLEDAVGAR